VTQTIERKLPKVQGGALHCLKFHEL